VLHEEHSLEQEFFNKLFYNAQVEVDEEDYLTFIKILLDKIRIEMLRLDIDKL
jgi:hypothetical protein